MWRGSSAHYRLEGPCRIAITLNYPYFRTYKTPLFNKSQRTHFHFSITIDIYRIFQPTHTSFRMAYLVAAHASSKMVTRAIGSNILSFSLQYPFTRIHGYTAERARALRNGEKETFEHTFIMNKVLLQNCRGRPNIDGNGTKRNAASIHFLFLTI